MNRVVVGNRESCAWTDCTVGRVNWVAMAPPTAPIQVEAQVRYRSSPAAATLVPLEGGRVKLLFDGDQFGITPGQAAVFYRGDVLLGGGLIAPNPTLARRQGVAPNSQDEA